MNTVELIKELSNVICILNNSDEQEKRIRKGTCALTDIINTLVDCTQECLDEQFRKYRDKNWRNH